jgi:hypothetical protein
MTRAAAGEALTLEILVSIGHQDDRQDLSR